MTLVRGLLVKPEVPLSCLPPEAVVSRVHIAIEPSVKSLPRLLVIFDLDETLVRATGNPTLDPPDFMLDAFRVRRRPMAAECLRAVSRFADIAIWSAASDSYVQEILSQLIPSDLTLEFVWGCSRCTRRYDHQHLEEYWIKDLNKVKRLGYCLERVLIVDDSPEKVERHYSNHVRIDPFYGDLEDRALPRLATYLETFAEIPNVRTIEKRGWPRH